MNQSPRMIFAVRSLFIDANRPNESLPSEPIQSATSIPDNQETSEVKMVMIEAERKSFSRLLIHPTMIQDHLPNCYFHSIHQLQQQHRSRKERN